MALVAALKALLMITKPVTAENEEGIRTGTAEGVGAWLSSSTGPWLGRHGMRLFATTCRRFRKQVSVGLGQCLRLAMPGRAIS